MASSLRTRGRYFVVVCSVLGADEAEEVGNDDDENNRADDVDMVTVPVSGGVRDVEGGAGSIGGELGGVVQIEGHEIRPFVVV